MLSGGSSKATNHIGVGINHHPFDEFNQISSQVKHKVYKEKGKKFELGQKRRDTII